MATIRDGEETISSADERFVGMFTIVRGGEIVDHEIELLGGSLTLLDAGLLYCTSLENTDEVFEMMADKFDVDAAFEITDVEAFGAQILALLVEREPHLEGAKADLQRLLNNPVPDADFQAAMLRHHQREIERLRPLTMRSGPVDYYDSSPAGSVADMPGVDSFRKPRGYSWQREHRIVITPFECAGGVDLEIPALCELLRIVR